MLPRPPRPSRSALILALAVLAASFVASPIGASEAAEIRRITLPIAADRLDDVHWRDTYGAARSRGRSHIGVDIMGEKMIPLVAARSGVVTWGRFDNRRGSIIRFRDDEGWEYQYIHLNNDSPGTDDGNASCTQTFSADLCATMEPDGDLRRGVRVTEGEIIAYLGDGGNAEWTRPHLHFEIYRPAGGRTVPINPTASVDQARQRIVDGVAGSSTAPPAAAPGAVGFTDHVWYRLYGRYPNADERSSFDQQAAGQGVWAAVAGQLDGTADAAAIDRLYLAFFGRYPDIGGLDHWLEARGDGHGLDDIAEWFADSEEFRLRYGRVDFAVFLDRLYSDVLDRAADTEGKQYWLTELRAGRVTRGSIVVYFTESAELRQQTSQRSELVALARIHGERVPTDADASAWAAARSGSSLPDAVAWWYANR